MTIINGYAFDQLNNDKSGFSKWGFAKKDGKNYFIKELLNPVYPINPDVMSEAQFMKKRQACKAFEERFRNYYAGINSAGCGNLVRIVEFFRHESKYYVVTEKIETDSVSLSDIVSASLYVKLLLLKTVIHCFTCLHNAQIVHFDVKSATENLLQNLLTLIPAFLSTRTARSRNLEEILHTSPRKLFWELQGKMLRPMKNQIFLQLEYFFTSICAVLFRNLIKAVMIIYMKQFLKEIE